MDEYDKKVFLEGIMLSGAVHRFLQRIQTQKVIAAGILDEDVVRDLIKASDKMYTARQQRLEAARSNQDERRY